MKLGNIEQLKPVMYLVASTVCMFLFAQGAAYAYGYLGKEQAPITLNTETALASVSGMSTQEANETLTGKIQEWKANQSISFSFTGENLPFDSEWAVFDTVATVKEMQEGKSQSLVFTIDREAVKSVLETEYPAEIERYIDWEKMFSYIDSLIAELKTEGTVEISAFYSVSDIEELASNSIQVKDASSAEEWIGSYAEVIVDPEGSFSFSELLKQDYLQFSKEFLGETASLIYKTVLATNMEVTERHISETVPAGIETGYEAAVSLPERDFAFRNPGSAAVVLQFSYSNGELNLIVKGGATPVEYEIYTENFKEFEPRTIIHYSHSVNKAQVIEKGMKGAEIEVYKKGYFKESGEQVGVWKVSTDFYLPKNKVLQHPQKNNDSNENESPVVEMDQGNPEEQADEKTEKTEETEETNEPESTDTQGEKSASKKENNESDSAKKENYK